MDTEKLYDQEYFRQRIGLEEKHFTEVLTWWYYLRPEKVIEIGCGYGHRVFAFNHYDIDCEGCDLEFPISNSPYHEIKDKLRVGNAINPPFLNNTCDLIIYYDVLEHLPNVDAVREALRRAYQITKKHIVVSVPVIGDPNLLADKTHMIHKTMEWWQYQVQNAGFKLMEVPNKTPYKHQMIWGIKS